MNLAELLKGNTNYKEVSHFAIKRYKAFKPIMCGKGKMSLSEISRIIGCKDICNTKRKLKKLAEEGHVKIVKTKISDIKTIDCYKWVS